MPDEWQPDHARAGFPLPACPGPIRRHPADELVAEDDPVARFHDGLVADCGRGVAELVGVHAGVQVGAADPAALDVDDELTRPWRRCLDVMNLKFAVLAHNCSHGFLHLSTR